MEPARLTLPAAPASVQFARAWVRLILDDSPGREAVEQVVSELVGEALIQGAVGSIDVELHHEPGTCLAVVAAAEPGYPPARTDVDLVEHPRLVIVDHLVDILEHFLDADGRSVMSARITWSA